MKYAVLIDGGFVRRRVGSAGHPATAAHIRYLIATLREHECLAPHALHRIYYYDARPLDISVDKPLLGGKIDFASQPLVGRSQALFSELAREPYFALRMGDLSFDGWTLRRGAFRTKSESLTIDASALNPKITQKGVDMRIGMDIAALTLKNLAQVIVLVSGDSDFVPAMKFARREGAQLFLVPLGHGIKEVMREHSDLVLDITVPPADEAP